MAKDTMLSAGAGIGSNGQAFRPHPEPSRDQIPTGAEDAHIDYEEPGAVRSFVDELVRANLTPVLMEALKVKNNRVMFEFEYGRMCRKVVEHGFKK
jgi:hypothetical protein